MLRSNIAVALVLGLATFLPAFALAQSCASLTAQESQLASAGTLGREHSAYQTQYAQMRQHITHYRAQLRSAGCGFNIFRPRNDRVCQSVRPKLVEAETALSRLERKRRNTTNTARQRLREVRRALHRRGCNGSRTDIVRTTNVRTAPPPSNVRSYTYSEPVEPKYRTLCVRACDGYMFPISFETERFNFTRDQNICSMQCPAGNAELYVHRSYSEWTEQAKSLDGTPLTKHPKAFRYRKKFDPSCSCHRTKARSGIMVIAGATMRNTQLSIQTPTATGTIRQVSRESGFRQSQGLGAPYGSEALAIERPMSLLDPDSRYNRQSGASLAQLFQLLPPVEAHASSKVRVIVPRRLSARSGEVVAPDQDLMIVR